MTYGGNRSALIAAMFALASCSADRTAPPAPASTAAIAVASRPAAGAIVRAPLNSLELRFTPPARLDEITVTGPDGTMPMMVHAVGEVASYSIPLAALGAGTYTVAWRASAGGRESSGSFRFTIVD